MTSKQFIRHVDYAAGEARKDARLSTAACYADEREAVESACERYSVTQSTLIRVALAVAGVIDPTTEILCRCDTKRPATRSRCSRCGLVRGG